MFVLYEPSRLWYSVRAAWTKAILYRTLVTTLWLQWQAKVSTILSPGISQSTEGRGSIVTPNTFLIRNEASYMKKKCMVLWRSSSVWGCGGGQEGFLPENFRLAWDVLELCCYRNEVRVSRGSHLNSPARRGLAFPRNGSKGRLTRTQRVRRNRVGEDLEETLQIMKESLISRPREITEGFKAWWWNNQIYYNL